MYTKIYIHALSEPPLLLIKSAHTQPSSPLNESGSTVLLSGGVDAHHPEATAERLHPRVLEEGLQYGHRSINIILINNIIIRQYIYYNNNY